MPSTEFNVGNRLISMEGKCWLSCAIHSSLWKNNQTRQYSGETVPTMTRRPHPHREDGLSARLCSRLAFTQTRCDLARPRTVKSRCFGSHTDPPCFVLRVSGESPRATPLTSALRSHILHASLRCNQVSYKFAFCWWSENILTNYEN